MRLDAALREFQQKKIHVAMVEDAQAQVLGLITLEDVIEELVGEIRDEFE